MDPYIDQPTPDTPPEVSPDVSLSESPPNLKQPKVSRPAEPDGSAGAERARKLLIRRVAAKAVEISKAPKRRRNVLAAAFGLPDSDVVKLTVAVMTASRTDLRSLSDITELAAADPLEAGVMATSMSKPQLKAVWGVLDALEATDGSPLPSVDMKAVLMVARAATSMDSLMLTEVAAAVALGSKH